MGQEISQQNKCSIVRRNNVKETNSYKHPPYNTCSHLCGNTNNNSNLSNNNINNNRNSDHSNIYATSSISTASSASASTTDDENYQLRQKYSLNKQTYEQSRVAKKFSLISNANSDISNATTATSSSTVTSRKYTPSIAVVGQHQRKHSQSEDSGIYYSSCHCASIISSASSSSATASSNSLCSCSCSATATSTTKSRSSLDKQKHYLCRHLYIKSYLDILEEDEKARATFQAARPGGIRNYKPKILADASPLSSSAPHSSALSISHRNTRLREKCQEDPWI